MTRKSTIGENPLDALLPDAKTPAAAKASRRGQEPVGDVQSAGEAAHGRQRAPYCPYYKGHD
jgi:hypothetical protein